MAGVEVLHNFDRVDAQVIASWFLRQNFTESQRNKWQYEFIFLSDVVLAVLILSAQEPTIYSLDDGHLLLAE